jgi:hypothetical protein
MPTTYATIKDALESVLDNSADLSIVYTEPQDNIITPSAQILSGNPVVEYYQTMGTGLNLFRFTVLVCVQRFETLQALDRLDVFIYGDGSIKSLVEADPTLGGVVSTSIVTRCSNLGMVQSGETVYLGAEFEVEVYV